MFDPRYTTIVTGIAGQIGRRLLPLLRDFSIYGLDVTPPETDAPLRFAQVDLGSEACCRHIVELLQQTGAANVVHLAFVDPGSGADMRRMWQTNVAGTARVMEAITEVNRTGGAVRKFVFTGGAVAYGTALSYPFKEDMPLAAVGLPYAVHKQEADEVAQLRAAALGACSSYILRPQAYADAGADNYVLRAFRGVPAGTGQLGRRLRRQGKRAPLILPRGAEYLDRQFQFVHPNDVARLIAFILRRPERAANRYILNIAGRGHPLTLRRCAAIAGTTVRRLPGVFLCRWRAVLAWNAGAAAVPPEALPYLLNPPVVDTARIRAFLGSDYEGVIQHTMEEAFSASFPVEDPAPSDPGANVTDDPATDTGRSHTGTDAPIDTEAEASQSPH